MNPDEIRERFRRDPFEPFRIQITSGAYYDIVDPNSIALGRRRMFIAFSDEADRWAELSYLHVAAPESLRRNGRTRRTPRRKRAR